MTAPCPTLGFLVHLDLAPAADLDRVLDAFIEFLEARGLVCGGGGDRSLEYAVSGDGLQATAADRDAVHAWAAAQADLTRYAVGPLIDLEHAG